MNGDPFIKLLSNVIGGPLGCFLLIGLFVTLGSVLQALPSLFEDTFPILLMFLVAVAVWTIARKREESIIAKAVASVVAPAAIALGVLMATLLVLNSMRMSAEYGKVAKVEQFLIDFRFSLAEATHMPLWLFCSVVFLLIAVVNLLPHVRAVSVFFETKKRVAQGLAILTVLTNFTLFAQLPAGDSLEKRYSDVMNKFEASLRREKAAVAQAAAAQAVRNEATTLPPDKKETLRNLLTRFERIDVPEGMATDSAVAQILDADGIYEPPASEAAVDSRPLPRTHTEYAAAEREAVAENLRAEEAEKGAKEIVGEVIGSFLPELGGYGGKFAEKMIDGLAERVYGPWVERVFRRNAAFTSNIVALHLAAGDTTHLDSTTLSAVIDRAEPEANKRIAAKREADERMRRRERELDISEIEFDERLSDIRDFVKKHPMLPDDQFQDVVAYAKAVRSGRIPLYRDPMQLDLHAPRWEWVEHAIVKEKAQTRPGGLAGIDPEHPAEHPEVHPEFHPIP